MKSAAEVRYEFEKSLQLNIGLMAKRLQEAGIQSTDIDKIGEDALKYIQDKAEGATKNNPLEAGNVENVIIMLLMHGAIASQKVFINEKAKALGVTNQKIIELMHKDTVEHERRRIS